MYKFPCVKSYEKLESLFESIINSEVPDKFTYRYLADIGFASSKDRDMLPALKMLGFVDEKGLPTDSYRGLKDSSVFKKVLLEAIEDAYQPLFETLPNAKNVSENVLTDYFMKLTEASHANSNAYKKTFLELLRLAEDSEETQAEHNTQEPNSREGLSVKNVNLNINLPTTTDDKVYESLFKHLKDLLAR